VFCHGETLFRKKSEKKSFFGSEREKKIFDIFKKVKPLTDFGSFWRLFFFLFFFSAKKQSADRLWLILKTFFFFSEKKNLPINFGSF